MDIASLSTALSNASVANSFGTAMLGKQLDVTETMGQSMVNALNAMPAPSLEHSVNPAVGGNFDVSV